MAKLLYESQKNSQLKAQSLLSKGSNVSSGQISSVTNKYNTKAAHRKRLIPRGNWTTFNGRDRFKLGRISISKTGKKGVPK